MNWLRRVYRKWFPKRRSSWPPGTKRQRAIGGMVCIAIWLAFIMTIMSAGGINQLNLSPAVAFILLDFNLFLLFGIFLLINAATIKESRSHQKEENSKK